MARQDQALSRRTLLQGAAGVTAAGILAGPAPAAATPARQDGEPREGGTLTLSIAQITSNSHLLHLRHFAGSENIYTRLLANARLITLDAARTDYIGDLAESFTFADDGSTLTFALRPGLTWHDGAPFTAEDVSFTYHMIGIPGVGPTLMGSLFLDTVVGMREWLDGEADSISGLTTPDELTVVFALFPELSQSGVLSYFNQVCIAPNHILSGFLNRETGAEILQSAWATTAEHIGLGPFRVVEYVPDQFIRYEPFAEYHRGQPLLGELVYRSFADPTTNAAALQNQEVDATRVPTGEYERFQALDFLTFKEVQAPSYRGTPFNARQPFLNKDVRQGLLHAIDREAIAQALFAGAVQVVHSPISVPVFGDSPNLKTYEYDPEKARALLASGGWDPSRKLRWAVGQVPSTEQDLAYYAALNGFWEAVGVQTEFQVFGTDSTILWGPEWNFDLYPSAYPIGVPESIAIHYDPDRISYVSSGFDTPEFRELWQQAMRQHPEDEMREIVWRLQETIAEEALALMITRSDDIWGINNRVHGLDPAYFPYEADLYDWRLEQVWVDE